MSEEPAAVDPRVLAELRSLQDDASPRFFRDLIDQFLAQGREKLVELREGLRSQDVERIARVAHTLRGSAGSLGARRLSFLAGAVEDDLRAGASRIPEDRIAAIEAEFDRVRATLEPLRSC